MAKKRSSDLPSPVIRPASRATWRRWLERHHASKAEVWLAYYKKHTGKPSVRYAEAVEEALCFGWIDGIVKRVDEDSYIQRYTPRRPASQWSMVNLRRFERLVQEGRVTAAGFAKGPGATTRVASVSWLRPDVTPDDIASALQSDAEAWAFFSGLAPSYRKQYVHWIDSAKRPETRARRIREAIAKLLRGEKRFPIERPATQPPLTRRSR